MRGISQSGNHLSTTFMHISAFILLTPVCAALLSKSDETSFQDKAPHRRLCHARRTEAPQDRCTERVPAHAPPDRRPVDTPAARGSVIVTPEFLDHWKTRMLVDELQGDETAPLLVLRLWAHCQVRKTHRLGRVSASALKSICRYNGSHEALWLALQNSGFIEVKHEQVDVHQWSVYNQGLINSWINGRKGGRPKKPTGIPQVSHGEPTANPNVTDKIGLERIGGEKNGSAAEAAPTDAQWISELSRNPAYEGIDVRRELEKMKVWCSTNKKVPSKRRFVNWLNRAEKPINGYQRTTLPGLPEPRNWKRWLNEKLPDSPLATGGATEAHEWSGIHPATQAGIISRMREEPLES